MLSDYGLFLFTVYYSNVLCTNNFFRTVEPKACQYKFCSLIGITSAAMKHSSTVRWTETVCKTEVWTLAEAANVSSLYCHIQTAPWAHPFSCPKGTGRSFPEGKAAGAWSLPSSPVGVKFENARNISSVPIYAIIQSTFAQCIHFASSDYYC